MLMYSTYKCTDSEASVLYCAGQEPPAMSQTTKARLQRMQALQQANFWSGKRTEAPPLEQHLYDSLCELLSMEMEWRKSPCGALQCAATERERITCFVVETRKPRLPVLYTKFDFDKPQAEQLAAQLCQFLRVGEGICESHIGIVNEPVSESVTKHEQAADRMQALMSL